MALVFLNGELMPLEEARVPVLDRGFVFGDGVYEVIPVYGGRLFRLPHHLHRLQNSLDGIRLANPLTAAAWTGMLEELVRRNGGGDLSVYLQVTRGVAPRDHAFPPNTPPTVFAMAKPLPAPVLDPALAGVKAVTLEDIRWRYCHIKAITLLPNVLLRQAAVEQGAHEAILVRDGIVTEGAASNVFIVRAGRIITPPKGPYLLPGITRDLVLELAAANGIPHAEESFTPEALSSAEEVWLTSSTREISPVVLLDNAPVANREPGPLWSRLLALVQDYKAKVRAGLAS